MSYTSRSACFWPFKASLPSGVAAICLTLSMACWSQAGLINGGIVSAPATTSLTVEGINDWHYWEGSSTTPFEEKAAPTLSIGAMSAIGAPTLSDFGGGVGTTYSWTDGTGGAGGGNGLLQAFPAANGEGFSLVLPADTHTRRARFYVGGNNATGEITATLSDGSAGPDVVSSAFAGAATRVYEVSYRADSAGETLTIDWVRTATGGGAPNIFVSAASLQSPLLDNAGFELPGGAGFPQATSWSGSAPTALHSAFPHGNSDGLGASFAFNTPNAADITQTSTETFVAGATYSLTAFGVDNDINNENDLELAIGYDSGGFVPLASQVFDLTGLDDWTFLDGLSYTSNGGAELGSNVVVRIRAINVDNATGGVFFDEVSLSVTPPTVTAPEPSTLILASLGLLGLSGSRRRQR